MAQSKRKKDYSRKIPIHVLARLERRVGEIIALGYPPRYYSIKRIDKDAGIAYLVWVGPLE
jgi:hypothetical protein